MEDTTLFTLVKHKLRMQSGSRTSALSYTLADPWQASVHMCMQNTAMGRRWNDLTGHTVNPPRYAVKEDAQRKESAAQAYVTLYKRGPTRGSTLLKWHYKRQTARCNPAALGLLIRAQQKECPRPSLCSHATRTALSFLCRLLRLRITAKQPSVWIHFTDNAARWRIHQGHRLR